MGFKGFTLIELLVAITILAILSSIGLVFYNQAEITARDGRRQGDLQESQKALEQYYSIFQKYPDTDAKFYSDANLQASFQAGAAPKDPTGGNYTYKSCTGGTKFVLCATLESCTASNNKCNASGVPADGCSGYATGTAVYCVSSLSN